MRATLAGVLLGMAILILCALLAPAAGLESWLW